MRDCYGITDGAREQPPPSRLAGRPLLNQEGSFCWLPSSDEEGQARTAGGVV